MNRTWIIGGLVLVAVAALGWMNFGPGSRTATTANASVNVPDLSGTAAEGAALFSKYCVECHGEYAGGSDKGPPLIHKYYEPNHHPDQAFLVGTLYGVRQHHWKFGNMEPVEGITEDEVIKIITYVRAVQRANGIQ
jgi:mono/diheme cytochrome c family protein